MLRTNFFKQTLIGLAVISTSLMLASCSDDSGEDSGPNIEKGTVDVNVSGNANLDLEGGNATFVDSTTTIFAGVASRADYVVMDWQNNGNTLTTAFTYGEAQADRTIEEIDTGTYRPDGETEFVAVSLSLDSVTYQISEGAVRLAEIKEKTIRGEYLDVILKPAPGAKDSLRLNGQFYANNE